MRNVLQCQLHLPLTMVNPEAAIVIRIIDLKTHASSSCSYYSCILSAFGSKLHAGEDLEEHATKIESNEH